jgi:DNA repair protein RecO (recombination protein O)
MQVSTMLRRTEGIVLKNAAYKEADLIVSFLTADYGLINAYAKSPRKIKSRFGSSLEPLTYSKISFWGKEDANLPRLTQADIIRPFQAIRESISSFLTASGMLELTLRFLPEREANREAFNLLLETLGKVENDLDRAESEKKPDITASYFKVKFLGLSGHAPRLTGCARCGNPYDAKHGGDSQNAGGSAPFYMSHGSVLCRQCAKAGDSHIRLSAGAVKLYETLTKWDASKLGRLKPAPMLLSELNSLLDAHIEYTLSMPLRVKAYTP